MSTANRLYDRPDLDQQFGALALYVTGSLPNAQVLLAYEGRLQIHNAIGACSVEVLDGVLPPGGQVYVDNATSEIVVAWPAYSETPSPPDNAGFETGDLTGWSYTTIGGGGTPVVTSNYPHSGSHSAYWAGGKGLGSEGGIECVLLNDKACVAYPGQRINFKASILYNPAGGTPKGSRGQVRLNWYDGAGALIETSYGDLIKGRAYNAKWTDSLGNASGPPGTRSARLAVWLTATGAGHSYCDDASWDAPAIVGTKDETTISLWLRVHDAGGRVKDWLGHVAVIVDSDPYWATVNTLLHFDGDNGSATYTDETGQAWLPVGTAPVLTTANYKFGPSSLSFVGTGWIRTNAISATPWLFVGNDLTMEAWIKPTLVSDGGIISRRVGGTNGWALEARATGAVWFRANIGSVFSNTAVASAAGVLTAGVWQHVALCRSGNVWTIYVNGVSVGSSTITGGLTNDDAANTAIGASTSGGGENPFKGLIDEVRVNNGHCYYTGDFIPRNLPFPNHA